MMRFEKRNGIFVVFEGIDGCGKTTQSKAFFEAIRRRFVSESGREPGTTVVGEGIRKILQDPSIGEVAPFGEMLMFFAAGAQYVKDMVAPALKSKKIFVSDRFRDSTKAYQGYGLGVNIDLIDRINSEVCAGIVPDRAYLVDADVDTALENIRKQGKPMDKIEKRGKDYFERVRQGYLEIAAQNPERYRIIKYQDGKPDAMHEEVMADFNKFLEGFDKSKLIPM
jgi:dTMP kinase